jgi:hypothetical protein
MKNPAALQFFTQAGAPGTYYHTPFNGTYMFVLHTYIIHVSIVSRLRSLSLAGLLPFIYTD